MKRRLFGWAALAAFCAAVLSAVQFASDAQAQDESASVRLWSLGYYWDIHEIEWVEFHGQYDIRAIAVLVGADYQSDQPERLSLSASLDGLCATLLSHRPFPPADAIGSGDIFRISLNLPHPDDPDILIFERAFSMSVVNGECLEGRLPVSLPLSYQSPLGGWQFAGFANPDTIDVLEPWDVEAVPIFLPPDGVQSPVPLDLLCEAAAFEARYWRRLGSFRQGARLAIGVQASSGTTNFVRAIHFPQGCQFPQPGDTDEW